jgi:hypothetical protein
MLGASVEIRSIFQRGRSLCRGVIEGERPLYIHISEARRASPPDPRDSSPQIRNPRSNMTAQWLGGWSTLMAQIR